jgi:hypothetical protein
MRTDHALCDIYVSERQIHIPQSHFISLCSWARILPRCNQDTPRRTSCHTPLLHAGTVSYDEEAIGVVNLASDEMLREGTAYVRAITGLHINQQRENLNHSPDEKCSITVHICCIVYSLPLFKCRKQYSVTRLAASTCAVRNVQDSSLLH